MQCRQFRAKLIRFHEMPRGSRSHEAMRRHARRCHGCAAELRAEESLTKTLGRLAAPEMPAGFPERVLRQAMSSRGERRFSPRLIPIGLASGALAAAAVGAFLAVHLLSTSPRDRAGEVPQVALALHRPTQVGFVFHVHRALRDVRIVVSLPKGVVINGRRERRLAWHADLQRGDNVLKLPLVARMPGGGVVTAEVDVAGLTQPIARASLVAHTVSVSPRRGTASARTSGV